MAHTGRAACQKGVNARASACVYEHRKLQKKNRRAPVLLDYDQHLILFFKLCPLAKCKQCSSYENKEGCEGKWRGRREGGTDKLWWTLGSLAAPQQMIFAKEERERIKEGKREREERYTDP